MPLLPSLVAVIVAVPAVTAVTNPLALTVATGGLLVAHTTRRPVRMLPLASSTSVVSRSVSPTWTVAVAGITDTDATSAPGTLTAAVPLCPSLIAVIVTGPPLTPLTRPV